MRNKAPQVRAGHAIAFQHLRRGLGHLAHRKLEHRRPVLVNEVHLLVHRLMGRRIQAAAARHAQARAARSVNLMHKVDKADLALFARLNQNSAAAVAKQHAGGAVGIVGHARVGVGAAHQHLGVRAALHQLRARLQRKHKS